MSQMAQVQREWTGEVGKEAECGSLQSRMGAKEKRAHDSGKEDKSSQDWSKSTADTEGRGGEQSQRLFR